MNIILLSDLYCPVSHVLRYHSLSFYWIRHIICCHFCYITSLDILTCILICHACFVAESARPPSKRRKRKGSASNNSGVGNNNSRDVPPSGKQKRSPGPHGFNIGSSMPGVNLTTNLISPCALPFSPFPPQPLHHPVILVCDVVC